MEATPRTCYALRKRSARIYIESTCSEMSDDGSDSSDDGLIRKRKRVLSTRSELKQSKPSSNRTANIRGTKDRNGSKRQKRTVMKKKLPTGSTSNASRHVSSSRGSNFKKPKERHINHVEPESNQKSVDYAENFNEIKHLIEYSIELLKERMPSNMERNSSEKTENNMIAEQDGSQESQIRLNPCRTQTGDQGFEFWTKVPYEQTAIEGLLSPQEIEATFASLGFGVPQCQEEIHIQCQSFDDDELGSYQQMQNYLTTNTETSQNVDLVGENCPKVVSSHCQDQLGIQNSTQCLTTPESNIGRKEYREFGTMTDEISAHTVDTATQVDVHNCACDLEESGTLKCANFLTTEPISAGNKCIVMDSGDEDPNRLTPLGQFNTKAISFSRFMTNYIFMHWDIKYANGSLFEWVDKICDLPVGTVRKRVSIMAERLKLLTAVDSLVRWPVGEEKTVYAKIASSPLLEKVKRRFTKLKVSGSLKYDELEFIVEVFKNIVQDALIPMEPYHLRAFIKHFKVVEIGDCLAAVPSIVGNCRRSSNYGGFICMEHDMDHASCHLCDRRLRMMDVNEHVVSHEHLEKLAKELLHKGTSPLK